MFAKQHYKAIAKVVLESQQVSADTVDRHDFDEDEWVDFTVLVTCLAKMFKEDNPNFNRDKWFKAVRNEKAAP